MAKGIRWIWILAVLFALLNALVMLKRLPVMQDQQRTPEEIAAETAADWLRTVPPGSRVALLISHRDITSIWFHYRLGYFLYPQRHELVWDALPAAQVRSYDFVLAFDSAQRLAMPGWTAESNTAKATLYSAPTAKRTPFAAGMPPAPATALSVCTALWSLAAPVIIGLLLLGCTTPCSPFRSATATLALAHFTGAAAVAWITVLVTITTGTLTAWPVTILLALLSPGIPRAWRWFRTGCSKTSLPGRAQEQPFSASAGEHGGGITHDTHEPPPERAASVPEIDGARPWVWALAAMALLGVLTALLRGGMLGLDWDGYAIWQLKAKAFFVDHGFQILHDTGHFAYAHLDYPPLVPVNTWWVYEHLQAASDRWAQAAGFVFYLDLLAVYWAAARRYTSRSAALMGLAILACLPEVGQHAVSGFADIPLALGLLLVAALLMNFLAEGNMAARGALTWALCGVVLVKNEGILVALSAIAVTVGYKLWSKPPVGHGFVRSACMWLAATAASYGPWLVLRHIWALKNDLLEQRAHAAVGEPLPWRLGVTLSGYVTQMARIGPWLPAWGLLIVVFPMGLIASWRRQIVVTIPLWGLAAVQLTGYTAIYLITPLQLQGHLGSSVDRLMLHLIPTLLLASLVGCFGRTAKS